MFSLATFRAAAGRAAVFCRSGAGNASGLRARALTSSKRELPAIRRDRMCSPAHG